MSVELLPGYTTGVAVLPSYSGQDFEYMLGGSVARFSGEQHQSDSHLSGAYMVSLLPNYAGDAFEAHIGLHVYDYGTFTITGFLGPGQDELGDCTLGEGYSIGHPTSVMSPFQKLPPP